MINGTDGENLRLLGIVAQDITPGGGPGKQHSLVTAAPEQSVGSRNGKVLQALKVALASFLFFGIW